MLFLGFLCLVCDDLTCIKAVLVSYMKSKYYYPDSGELLLFMSISQDKAVTVSSGRHLQIPKPYAYVQNAQLSQQAFLHKVQKSLR